MGLLLLLERLGCFPEATFAFATFMPSRSLARHTASGSLRPGRARLAPVMPWPVQVSSGRHPWAARPFFLVAEVLVVGGYTGVPMRIPVVLQQVPFVLVRGHFLGRVLRESGGRGNPAKRDPQISGGRGPAGGPAYGRCYLVA